MTPGQRKNLERLLAPRTIAFIGGDDASRAIQHCVEAGFKGKIWAVNPRRNNLSGQPCYRSADELPQAPDAVFLAVPAAAVRDTVAMLRNKQAGGVVCFSAGFGELGEDGVSRERDLIETAGDLAVVGPNCSGVLNFVEKAPLWPFKHRNENTRRGVAFVTQSGMLGNTLTLNQRSVPIAFIISSGNQAMLGIEDYLEVLVDNPAVSAIGLYIEALADIPRFTSAAIRALEKDIPIVVQKAGSSEIGARLTITHTGSLSGADELYGALFKRLGIIQVNSPVLLLETLKLLTVSGAPSGKRFAAFTCSGGDATMLADKGERIGLSFPQPAAATSEILSKRLPDIATVSNPLDYTTPLWGDAEQLPLLIRDMLQDGYDAALLVQDYLDPSLGSDNAENRRDMRSFISATRSAGIPGAVCSCLPENIDQENRELMISGGVTPLLGINDALRALSNAAGYGIRRSQIQAAGSDVVLTLPTVAVQNRASEVLDEWHSKRRLAGAGIPVPTGQLASMDTAGVIAARIGFPVVAKMVSAGLPHKTDAGAVKVGLQSVDQVNAAVAEISRSVAQQAPQVASDTFLIERMVPTPVAELLLGIRLDQQFGHVMVLASGGTLVELVRDSCTLLLPTDRNAVADALSSLKVAALLDGYRGQAECDREMVIDQILSVADFVISNRHDVIDLDINPLMLLPETVVAADALLCLTKNGQPQTMIVP